MSASAWELLYIFQILTISTALGLLVARNKKWLPGNFRTRFLIGFCSTPYIIGIWVLIITSVTSIGTRYLFALPPFMLSFGYLLFIVYKQNSILQKSFIKPNKIQLNALVSGKMIVYVGFVVVLGYASFYIFQNSRQPLNGYDSLGYLTKAAYLITQKPISIIEQGGGAFRNDDHGLTFIGYLSHGLVMTSGEIGYPNDQAARDAFQLTYLYMILTILAVGYAMRKPEIGYLAALLIFLVPQFEYITFASSRDAFRIIPLMMCLVTLLELGPKTLDRKFNSYYLLPLIFLSYFAFEGHALGGVVVILMSIAWILWHLLTKITISKKMILILLALGFGCFMGGVRYIYQYLETGSLVNTSSSEWRVGTPLDASPLQQKTNAETMFYEAQSPLMLLSRDNYLVSGSALLIALAIILITLLVNKKIRSSHILFFSLVLILNLIPFSGIFDFPLISMSRVNRNVRYFLHIYPFASLVIAASFNCFNNWFISRLGQGANFKVTIVTIIFITGIVFRSLSTINVNWRMASEGQEWIESTINPMLATNESLDEGEKLLIEDMRYNYYLGNEAIAMFTTGTVPIFKAENKNITRDILRDLGIGAVVLTANRIYGWWDQIPLYELLEKSNKAGLIYKNTKYQIYYLVWDDKDRTKIVDLCVRNFGCNLQTEELISLLAKIQPDEIAPAADLIIENKFDQAAKLYEDYMQSKEPEISFYIVLAELYRNLDREEDMIEAFRAVYSLSTDTSTIDIYISERLKIQLSNVNSYIHKASSYQSPALPGTYYNFLDGLVTANLSSVTDSRKIYQTAFILYTVPYGVLFQHPPSQVSFNLDIRSKAWIQFSPVLAPDVWQFGKGDGVLFKIELETQDKAKYLIYEEYLDPKNVVSQRKLITKSINLARWSGQSAKIIFTTGCGPNDDCRFDWSGWGEPRILQPVAYNFIDHFSEADADTLGTETGQAEILSQSINNEERTVLYQHPSSQVVYSIVLPSSASMQFGLGMSPEVWTAEKSDGVEYNLYVRSLNDPSKVYRIFQRTIDPKNNPDDRRWFDERVDLSKFGGQAVEIIFEALPGPAGSFDFDWGGWSNPVLIDETLPDSMGVIAPYVVQTTP